MKIRLVPGGVGLLCAATVLAGCSSTGATPSPAGGGSVSQVLPSDTAGAPYSVKFDWGTFKLASRIIDKVKRGEPLNFVYSISDAGQPVFSAAIKTGFQNGVSAASAEMHYPLKARLIGPVGGGNEKQVAEIRSLLQANQIDALVFNASEPGPFVDILNQVMASGVPVWGTGGDSPKSNRIGFFALDEQAAGKLAGMKTAAWAKAKGVDVTKAALFTGDPAGPWAQARMRGFVEGLTAGFPNVQFVNSVENPYNTSFDFPKVYADTKAFITGHPDVQILFHTDQGVQMVGKAIADTGRNGKAWAVGFNLSNQILDFIKSGEIVATVGQGWNGQAKTAAHAAAAFIFKGDVIKGVNAAPPYPVTLENVQEAVKVLKTGGA